MTLEARPEFPCDTGIVVRAHALGGVGLQVLVDHRKAGAIGGIYGNSVGGFRAYPFVIDGDEQEGFKVTNLRAGTAVAAFFRPDFAASLEDFLKVWHPNDWNTFRIGCTGRLPLIETWINGMPNAKLDTEKLADRVPGYDPEVIFERIGRKGHLALEVHDSERPSLAAPRTDPYAKYYLIRLLLLVNREIGPSDKDVGSSVAVDTV